MGRGTVLVIDDERDLVNLVRYNLESEGYEVLGALDGESGLNLAMTRAPDLILLDRMMPGPDGVEVCRRLRREDRTAHVPVIMLTAKAAEEERVQGLDAGADDYVTKPFSVKELMARVRARLRHPPTGPDVPAVVRNGDLLVNEARKEVTYGGRPLALSPAEFRILHFLAACPGRVMFRRSVPPGDMLFGRLAVRQGLATREQVREALSIQDRDPSRRIGDLLFERFYLSASGQERLLDLQVQAFGGPDNSGELLGRLVVERRLATEFQVRDALRMQGRMVEAGLSPVPRLGEILVKRDVLTREALAAALELQNFMHYRCPQCGARIGIHPEPRRAPAICPQCRAEVPQLFAKMASALHQVLDEATEAQAVDIPSEVLAAADDPKRQFGKYVLVQEIGRGGAGVVHRAWQRDCNRVVALKQLPSSGDEGLGGDQRTPYGQAEAVKRFFTEARAIAELDHPNIVPIHDYGVAEQTFYYTMPLIDGGSLDALLHGSGAAGEVVPARSLSLAVSLGLVRSVARALDYAHQRGVVHRDIKPGNILIDRDGKPWLIDFGLAKVLRLGDPAYLKGIILGTPYYMAPEQAVGDMELVDAQSDIYSLGAVLYELLGGVYPFAGLKSDLVFTELLTRAPDPLESIDPGVPRELCRIVRTAMARERKDRYARAGEFAEEVDDYLKSLG
ncbi:MAG: response regulator [Planctomycetaceae bacterium]|nr:response regulator [Planctomycetaceae bacterium]